MHILSPELGSVSPILIIRRAADWVRKYKDAVEKIPEFESIFLSPHRSKIVLKEITDKCRNVKNSFRKAVNFHYYDSEFHYLTNLHLYLD